MATPRVRSLQRGTRGEDVLGWQTFLMNLRQRAEFRASLPAIVVDGIYGAQTARATIAFQLRNGLRPDGIVGPRTREIAQTLGMVPVLLLSGAPPPVQRGSPTSTTVPLIPIGPPPPPPPGPVGPEGSSREVSWRRLRAEKWTSSAAVQIGLGGGKAVIQSSADGSGDYVYDEYRVDVAMPSDLGAEAFLLEMARDLNGTVKDAEFNVINKFKRRQGGDPRLGEIIDIDILGPDDGSVMLVELGATYFVFQTIECPETGTHPENGSREFGFERHGSLITFYTRGVSRPGNFLVGIAGSIPQSQGWKSLMRGISAQMRERGGSSNFGSFQSTKEKHPN